MSSGGPRELNPLVQRVDTLLKRRLETMQQAEEEVPLLTEIVDPSAPAAPAARVLDDATAQELAAELERAVLEHLEPELERAVDQLRADLALGVKKTVREAFAAALAQARAPREP